MFTSAFLSQRTFAGAYFPRGLRVLQTTDAMVSAGVSKSHLIAATFTEAEAILHKIGAKRRDLIGIRVSGRKAIDVFRSFSNDANLLGTLGSVNLDFGHNPFGRGTCRNGIDPKETLRVLLSSGALAPVSAVYILSAFSNQR